jgi:hypothetical protein
MTLTCLQGRIVQNYTITWVSIICFQYCYACRTHIWTYWMISIMRKNSIPWVSDCCLAPNGHLSSYIMDQVTFRSSELLSSLCVRRLISSVNFDILIFFSETIWTTRTKLGRNVFGWSSKKFMFWGFFLDRKSIRGTRDPKVDTWCFFWFWIWSINFSNTFLMFRIQFSLWCI